MFKELLKKNKEPENKKKIQVLVWADSPAVITGFGIVCKNILKPLWDTGLYDFTIIGINQIDYYDRILFPYKIYHAENNPTGGQLGGQRIPEFLAKGKYDIVLTFQDLSAIAEVSNWIKKMFARLPQKQRFSWIAYFPVDSPPEKNWVQETAKADVVATYTKYGFRECVKLVPGIKKKLRIVPHGINLKNFYPLKKELVEEFKNQYLKCKGQFLILNVNRNMPRKDWDRTFRVFSLFKKQFPESKLYTLTVLKDWGGDLYRIAKNYNIRVGKDWLFPARSGTFHGIPVEQLNVIYNAADVLISTTRGEGWGMSITEAMATKTPILVPRNTSLPELIGEEEQRGYLCKCGSTSSEWGMFLKDAERIRPLVNVDDMVFKLRWIYTHQKEAKKKAEIAYKWVRNLDWPSISKKHWQPIFKQAFEMTERYRKSYIDEEELCPCGSSLSYKKCCLPKRFDLQQP